MLVLKINTCIMLGYSGWPTTLNSVGDSPKDTALHTKFQSETPAYGPAI